MALGAHPRHHSPTHGHRGHRLARTPKGLTLSAKLPLPDLLRIASESPPPWRALFGGLAATGARVSELRFLTTDCVDPGDGWITIRIEPHKLPNGSLWRPKRPASIRALRVRTEPVQGPLRAFYGTLEVARCAPPGRLVFWPEREAPPDTKSGNWALERACRKLGLPKVSTHAFRHARAVQAMAAGADPNQVRASLGHRGLSTTLGYLRDVPLLCELPSPTAEARPNGAATQYPSLTKERNWA